ncbi:MAG TPA: outer membrane beta-barrel protein [Candidatus Acidoferrum sp.]|nr:outer membrane beta-barrel protein [Candidatus Acidoferrum sp.]
MNATKTRILAGAVALAAAHCPPGLRAQTSTATVMDYRYPSNSGGAAPGHDSVLPLGGKVYLGFDAGVALQQNITLSDNVGDSGQVTFDPGARLDLQVGYNFTTNWAAEFELGLIISPVKYSYALGTDYMGVDLVQMPLMVNVIYSRTLGRGFSVYAGGGVGGIFSHYQDEYGDTTSSASAFAYQGLAGVKYALNRKWDLGVGYKFLGTTEYDVGSGVAYDGFTPTEYKSSGNVVHSILLTLTCKF